MNQYPNGVPLLPPSYLSVVNLTAARHDFIRDPAGAAWRWGVVPDVAHIIRKLTPVQIGNLSSHVTSNLQTIRLFRGDSPEYWGDMVRAMEQGDQTALDLILVSSMMTAPHTVTETPRPILESPQRPALVV